MTLTNKLIDLKLLFIFSINWLVVGWLIEKCHHKFLELKETSSHVKNIFSQQC